MIGSILWRLLQNNNWLEELNTDGSAGHDFEDQIVQRIFSAVNTGSGFKPFPPRTTLKLNTVSGLFYQIDVVVLEGQSTYHLIECKFTKTANIEELYALNAKLLDYAFGAQKAGQKLTFKGYFVTGLTGVNDNFYQYSIAWGITPIILGGIPPLEYMIQKTPKETPLHRQMVSLLEETTGTNIKKIISQSKKADLLFKQLGLCHQLWKQNGNNF